MNRGARPKPRSAAGCHGQTAVPLIRALGLVGVVLLAGCQATRVTISDTFPKGTLASPWVLDGEVWDGEFSAASDSLGEEGEQWAGLDPWHVWLAVYRHDTQPRQKLILRAFAFASPDDARRAYDAVRPRAPETLSMGDQACWTDDGVLVRWGRLVIDVFGVGTTRSSAPEQALYLAAFIEKKMPAGLPDAPE